MTTKFSDHLPTGDHASRPAATAVPDGTLYSCTDHDLIYQSDGSAWSTWATVGGGGSGGGTFSDWSPTWTASTTSPSIGNGTITGRQYVEGDFVHAWAVLTAGSTTTDGSGARRLSTPSTLSDGTQGRALGTWMFFESGTVRKGGIVVVDTADRILFRLGDGSEWWTQGTPATFQDGDVVSCEFAYEKA